MCCVVKMETNVPLPFVFQINGQHVQNREEAVALLSHDVCKKILLLVGWSEMQVRINGCMEKGWSSLVNIYPLSYIKNEQQKNNNTVDFVKIMKMRIKCLQPFVYSAMNKINENVIVFYLLSKTLNSYIHLVD